MNNITQLYQITPDELKEFITKGIKENLKGLVNNSTPPQEKYLTRKDVSDLLSISLPTLSLWVQKGLIPCYRVSNRVYFKASDIDASLNQIKI